MNPMNAETIQFTREDGIRFFHRAGLGLVAQAQLSLQLWSRYVRGWTLFFSQDPD